jgi:hypothetical protein
VSRPKPSPLPFNTINTCILLTTGPMQSCSNGTISSSASMPGCHPLREKQDWPSGLAEYVTATDRQLLTRIREENLDIFPGLFARGVSRRLLCYLSKSRPVFCRTVTTRHNHRLSLTLLDCSRRYSHIFVHVKGTVHLSKLPA